MRPGERVGSGPGELGAVPGLRGEPGRRSSPVSTVQVGVGYSSQAARGEVMEETQMRRDSSQAWMADTRCWLVESGAWQWGWRKGRLQGRRGKGREGRWAEAPEDPHT